MTTRKKPPTLADRLAAFSLALRSVVAEARREMPDIVGHDLAAPAIAAAVELVKGADLGNDPRTA